MSRFLRLVLLVSGLATLSAGAVGAGQMQQVNPGVARETAECLVWSGQRVDCFARTFGNGLSAVFADSENWNLPRNLGGNLAAAPSCVSRGPSSINCFATTDSGVLATIALEGSVWGRWSSLGGSLAPARVSCVTFGKERISCHARGVGGQFLERTRKDDGAWGEWRSFGAVFSADPACLSLSDGRDACFGRGPQGEFVALVPDEDAAHRKVLRISGAVEGRPACVAEGAGNVSCVIMEASGGLALWRGQATESAPAGALQHIDVQASGEPSCFARGSGMVCGWRNEKSELSAAQIASDGQHTDIAVPALGRIAGVKCLALASGSTVCIVTGIDKSLRYVSLLSSAHVSPEKVQPIAVAAPVTKPVPDNLEGTWNLADVSSGASCKVTLQASDAAKPGALKMAPGCHAIGLPQGMTSWKRDLGSLRFTGANSSHALHFTPMSGGKWMSPNQSSAVILSRGTPGKASPPDVRHEQKNPMRVARLGKGRAGH